MSSQHDRGGQGVAAQASAPGRLRALDTGPAFWLAMFAASAFGTNLGDFCAGQLGLPGPVSFGSLVLLCALAIGSDRRIGWRTESAYWTAIVVLRAAATNVADYFTEDLDLGYLLTGAALAVLALAAGSRTRPMAAGGGASPVIDGWYWAAMLLAGVFGTVGGDWVSHTAGLPVAAAVLTAMLLTALGVRARWFRAAMPSYWVAVLAERCAGTPVGDGLASRRALGLGITLATLCTATLFAAALFWRERVRRERIRRGTATAAA